MRLCCRLSTCQWSVLEWKCTRPNEANDSWEILWLKSIEIRIFIYERILSIRKKKKKNKKGKTQDLFNIALHVWDDLNESEDTGKSLQDVKTVTKKEDNEAQIKEVK